MIYRPATGAMWDPSVLFHDGTYYLFMMYDAESGNGLRAGHCFLATSADGVHWKDEGIVLEERERASGSRFYKCFVAECGGRFIMNHGVRRGEGQDTLRFYASDDLRTWNYITSTQPDERWYQRPGRWDHMYMLPCDEDSPETGLWGYVVSVPQHGTDLPGMMRTFDGVDWEVLPPAPLEWGETEPRDHFEYGGCERMAGRYYLIGGINDYMGSAGYSIYTFISDGPRGPFRPDPEAFRLCGSSGNRHVAWLAAWCRGNGELLISNYVSCEPGSLRPWIGKRAPWLLPLRKPVVDAAGHLRLGWWPTNERLKGKALFLDGSSATLDAQGPDAVGDFHIHWLAPTFDLRTGGILEGTVNASATGVGPDRAGAAGFVLDGGDDAAMSVQLGIGTPGQRETHVARLLPEPDGTLRLLSEDVTGRGCATVTGIDDGREHSFRLLFRLEMFELYIDDLLVQTYVRESGDGERIGLLVHNARATFGALNAWSMSLAAEA